MTRVERSVDTMSGLRSIALTAFLVMACALLPREAMGLETTNGSDINSTNAGNVGVGTSTLKYKFDSTSASESAPKSLLYRRWLHRHTTGRASCGSPGRESLTGTDNTLEGGVTPGQGTSSDAVRMTAGSTASTWTDSLLRGAIIKAALRVVAL